MGQTGLDKSGYLERLTAICGSHGEIIDNVFNVGDMMYELSHHSGKPVPAGKILDLPMPELRLLRQLSFEKIIQGSVGSQNILVNSHSVFRWNGQLFSAISIPEVQAFRPDIVVTLIEDIDAIKLRLDLLKQNDQLPGNVNYTLKDIIVWREEEMLVSEMLASVLQVPHYVVGMWVDPEVSPNPETTLFSLMFQPWKKKAYVSYPISAAKGNNLIWERVLKFRNLVHRYLTVFDPLSIDEKRLEGAMKRSLALLPTTSRLTVDVRGNPLELDTKEISEVLPDIDGQIVARDYKLVDQAQVIIAYFPRDNDGSPIIAGGVQSELEHAAASPKEILVVWEADRDPTPFIKLKSDHRFGSLEELESFLKEWCTPSGQLDMNLGQR
jgi:adenylate kinase